MFTTVAIVLIVGVAAVLAFAASRPDTFRVQRSTTIKAPPDKIFPLIDDFQRWGSWSPWEKLDPAMSKRHSGAPSGVGAVYEWEGDRNVGQGRMEIIESSPPRKVAIKLDFVKPFEAHNMTEFTLEPKGDSTSVTWTMQGASPFISKLISVFVSMDRMVGKNFESGLANMKAIAES